VLVAQGHRDEALAVYRDGLATAKALADKDPQKTDWQTTLMIAYYNLAEAGDDTSANFSAALAILKRLEAAGSLPTDKKPLIGKIEAKLAALKHRSQVD
jgi:tRNA U34 5-methylaminomethyl-2-thiouridine-forming methyltransferase MnmC